MVSWCGACPLHLHRICTGRGRCDVVHRESASKVDATLHSGLVVWAIEALRDKIIANKLLFKTKKSVFSGNVVAASIDSVEIENEDGVVIDSTQATCSRCGYETESYGDSAASVRRCLALLREECPKRQSNFYVESSD